MVRCDMELTIFRAAADGDLDAVKRLVGEGVSVDAANQRGFSPLHMAAWNAHLEVVKYLVSQGADVGVTDADGETALDYASHDWHELHADVASYLRSVGAGVDA